MTRWPNGDRPASEMTKREAIAALVLQGLVPDQPEAAAARAVEMADALLAELAGDA